jgi:outer membrane immunogenic protein
LYTAPVTGFAGFSNGFESKGGFGGVEAGYNWQRDRFVFGLETDFEFANIGDRFNVTTASNGGALGVVATQRLNGFGTVRGRVGIAYGSALFYATGGFAYGNMSDNIRLANGGATANLTFNGNGIMTGYVAGGGIEYRFTPAWSAKAEYQYIDLGSRNVFGTSTNGVFLLSNNIDAKFHTVRVGINYAWGAPVVAKY